MGKRRRASRRGATRDSGWRTPVLLFALVLGVAFIVLSGPAVFRDRLWKAMGPAVVLLVPVLAGVLWVAWRHPVLFLRRWNRWLAGLILSLDVLLFLSLFHPPDRSYSAAGLAGDVGQSLRGFLGAGTLASWTVSNVRVELPSWGSLWGLVLLALVGALVFSPRATVRALEQAGHRLARAGTGLAQRRVRAAPGSAPSLPRDTPPEASPPPAAAQTEARPAPPPRRPAPTVTPAVGGWQLPPLELLEPSQEFVFDRLQAQQVVGRLEQALASYGIEGKVVDISPGPAVAQYGVEPGWLRHFREVKERGPSGQVVVRQEETSRTRIKVEAITALSKDLALALAVPALRIIPVPDKGYVGVEVPVPQATAVGLRSVMEQPAFAGVRTQTRLPLALGLGVGGQAGVADLARLPHLLMAGATGSGKSVCLKALITCLVIASTPEQVRLVLVDPKRVEFVRFRALPHLLYPPIVEAEQAALVFEDLIQEMDQRYRHMAEAQVNNLEAYNRGNPRPLPYIAVLVDELADLMMAAPQDIERGLVRLAQLGRGAGMHLVVATQRPSVDVITGLIKANFPARISFAVVSQVDSRVILDMPGAEQLLGRGDMLFLATDAPQPRRFQGCFVTEAEMDRVVDHWLVQTRLPPSPGLGDVLKPPEGDHA